MHCVKKIIQLFLCVFLLVSLQRASDIGVPSNAHQRATIKRRRQLLLLHDLDILGQQYVDNGRAMRSDIGRSSSVQQDKKQLEQNRMQYLQAKRVIEDLHARAYEAEIADLASPVKLPDIKKNTRCRCS